MDQVAGTTKMRGKRKAPIHGSKSTELNGIDPDQTDPVIKADGDILVYVKDTHESSDTKAGAKSGDAVSEEAKPMKSKTLKRKESRRNVNNESLKLQEWGSIEKKKDIIVLSPERATALSPSASRLGESKSQDHSPSKKEEEAGETTEVNKTKGDKDLPRHSDRGAKTQEKLKKQTTPILKRKKSLDITSFSPQKISSPRSPQKISSPRTKSKSPRGRSTSKSPRRISISGVDDGIQEALMRHQLSPVISNAVLGIDLIESPPAFDFKESKDSKRKSRNDSQVPEMEISPGVEVVPKTTDTENVQEQDTNDAAKHRSLKTEATNLFQLPTTPYLEEDSIATPGAAIDEEAGSSTSLDHMRLHVSRMKKNVKKKIFDLKLRTVKEVLELEQIKDRQKESLVRKLESIGATTDPTEGIKFLCSIKVAALHSEGKDLRKEIKELEQVISEQVTLTNNLIKESLEIQKKTSVIVTEIRDAEFHKARYTSAVEALRGVHKSMSSLLSTEEIIPYNQTFVSNFVSTFDKKDCMQRHEMILGKSQSDAGTTIMPSTRKRRSYKSTNLPLSWQ
jgi:hypothetical protein